MKKLKMQFKDIAASVLMLIISTVSYFVIDQLHLLAGIIRPIADLNIILLPTLYFGFFALLVTAIILILSKSFNVNIYVSAFIVGIGGMLWHIYNYNFSYVSTYWGILGNGFYVFGALIALLLKMKTINRTKSTNTI